VTLIAFAFRKGKSRKESGEMGKVSNEAKCKHEAKSTQRTEMQGEMENVYTVRIN